MKSIKTHIICQQMEEYARELRWICKVITVWL